MNSIVLLGRTTAPLELKQTQAGKSVVSFSLAVKRPFTKDTTDFYTVVAWDKQAELLSKYVSKGDQICIRGHLTTRTWEDQQGNKRYATEVVASEAYFCEAKKDFESNNAPNAQHGSQGKFEPSAYIPDAYKANQASQVSFEDVDSSEDLPF
jgi:single-strand DNA-binding protein